MKSIAAVDRRKHKELFSLNLIRALAIVGVVLDHTIRGDMSEDMHCLINLVINPDAALFFMVSGALLMPVTGSYAEFIRRRVMRVFVPFVIWCLVYAFLYYRFDLLNEVGLANMVRWGWMTYTFGFGWFIPAMMAVYFVMPLLSPWIAGASRRHFHYVLILWLVSGLIPFFEVIGGVEPGNTPLRLFLTAVPYAIMGFYLTHWRYRQPLLPAYVLPEAGDSETVSAARRRVRRRKLAVLYSLMLLVGIVLPYAIRNAGATADFSDPIGDWRALPAIVMSLLYFSLLVRVRTLGAVADRVVNFVARYSYGIYLSHFLLCGLLLPRYMPGVSASTPATFAVTLGGAIVVTFVLRRIPFIGRYIV